MFDTPAHALWLAVFAALDVVAFVWLVRVVRRRRAKDHQQRTTAQAAEHRKTAWARTLDEREANVTASIVGSRLTVEGGGQAWPGSLDLAAVTTVSVVVSNRSGDVRRHLDIVGIRAQRVPVRAQGFDVLIGVLNNMPGFDVGQFEEAMWSTTSKRVTVLTRPMAVNTWLAGPGAERFDAKVDHNAFMQGLSLAREQGSVPVNWDVTYDELARAPGVSVAKDEYGTEHIRFGRVQLGGLTMDDLRVRLPNHDDRRDVPVKDWRTSAVLTQGGDENYRLLKEYFSAVMDEPLMDAATYERADQSAWRWRTAGIRVGLVYFYNSEMSSESRYCSVTFENARLYPKYLRSAYTAEMSLERVRWA